ncbi:CD1375 family protein [Enterococcus avium]|nr:CD1375 family protein [Enterococcus avium]MDT2392797.1 CD1375 family protein [Enterococcus avium]MDT2416567.1 CD1375 family protein [Enterococcus avium]MDT2429899.1 CD1375 family protein [Enterococcus avium]MDT2438885.1 CD1375 family protein [Enterococcus avium]MDT2452005.1 CD1375 family protein [Enterococcus avium]
MAKVFASLVEKGVMKIDKVPDELKKEVKAILAKTKK